MNGCDSADESSNAKTMCTQSHWHCVEHWINRSMLVPLYVECIIYCSRLPTNSPKKLQWSETQEENTHRQSGKFLCVCTRERSLNARNALVCEEQKQSFRLIRAHCGARHVMDMRETIIDQMKRLSRLLTTGLITAVWRWQKTVTISVHPPLQLHLIICAKCISPFLCLSMNKSN